MNGGQGWLRPASMTRRSDYQTAEIFDLVLLTRAAFGESGASSYANMAGLSPSLFAEILGREVHNLRGRRLCGYSTDPDERRRVPRDLMS